MKGDRRGVEGLPLRLMLTALLISLSLPALLSAMEGVDAELDNREMSVLAEDIASRVREMMAAGPGNVRMISIPEDLPSDLYLSLGGAEGSAESFRLSWGNARHTLGSLYLEKAIVLTDDGRPLELRAGDRLRMTCPPGSPGTVLVQRA
ncbi:MAG: hypothetical protein JXA45_02790 [Methanomassiliicoccales archaeon]|nr:hypothetical protein [Methanomassiliicoccales archaeon]